MHHCACVSLFLGGKAAMVVVVHDGAARVGRHWHPQHEPTHNLNHYHHQEPNQHFLALGLAQ